MADENDVSKEMEDQEERTFKIKVHGEVKEVTEEELIAAAQKWYGVGTRLQSELDRKKQEMDELAESAVQAYAFIEDLQKWISKRDNEAASRLMKNVGWEKWQLEALAGNRKAVSGAGLDEESSGDEDAGEDYEEEGQAAERKPRPAPRKIKLEDLDEDLQALVRGIRQEQMNRMYRSVMEDMRSFIANDEFLGKIVKGSPQRADSLAKLAEQILVRKTAVEGQRIGPRVYNDVLNELRQYVGSLGIRVDEEKPDTRSLAALGLGLEDGGDDLRQAILSERPIQREPVTSPHYGKNLLARLAQKMATAKATGKLGEQKEENIVNE